METSIIKRSVVIGGHKTSVSLETPFWDAMKELARLKGTTLTELISRIDAGREQSNLSSAIRLFVLNHYVSRAPKPDAEGKRLVRPKVWGIIFDAEPACIAAQQKHDERVRHGYCIVYLVGVTLARQP